jgi:magnesium-protoporphyrin O-methyltransferase
VDCARLGAAVTGIDLSPTLVDLARERLPDDLSPGEVKLLAGDMLDAALGDFDHLVAMDSLIHYAPEQAVAALVAVAPRVRRTIVFTFAPGSLPLRMMMMAGRLFPRGDRSPAIVPVAPERMHRMLAEALGPLGWQLGRTERVARGFYTSQAQELIRR